MVEQTPQPLEVRERDGTSQADRIRAALDPPYAAIDERTIQDLLAYTHAFATNLNFYEVVTREGIEQLSATGTWQNFLGDDFDLDAAVAFIEDPNSVTDAEAAILSRPHVALFLAFLKLLQRAQGQLNRFTQRHLEYYYQDVLRLTKRDATPGNVIVLAELAPTVDEYWMPAGTPLDAGEDSIGQPLIYTTDHDIVVNKAQINSLRSLYIDRRVTGIRDAMDEHEGKPSEAFMYMLQIALGEPVPGGDLAPYPGRDTPLTYDDLVKMMQFVDLVRDVKTGYALVSISELRSLMAYKQQVDAADEPGGTWEIINGHLESAGKTTNSRFRINPKNSHDFEANLTAAAGAPISYGGLRQVEDVYDLYTYSLREDVRDFILETLHFPTVDAFLDMMRRKVALDAQWAEIRRILLLAARRKRGNAYNLRDTDDFDTIVNDAFGTITNPQTNATIPNLDAFYAGLLEIERYFFMSAERFSMMMHTAKNEDATSEQWEQTYRFLARAHEEKTFAARRQMLQQLRETDGYEAMLRYALGDSTSSSSLSITEQFLEQVKNQEDRDFLRSMGDASNDDARWPSAYDLVERTQRTLVPVPAAQEVRWLNIYPNPDATTASVSYGAGDDTPRWRTFGESLTATENDVADPTFGWAVCSPVLGLSEGQRTISLTLGLDEATFDSNAIDAVLPSRANPISPFRIQISTEKAWIEPDEVQVQRTTVQRPVGDTTETLPALRFTLLFGEAVDAITANPEARVDTGWPVLRVMLRQIWEDGQFVTRYEPFQPLTLRYVDLSVSVNGLTPQQIQNDDTNLNPKKPFQPFRSDAIAGARFMVGHEELISKRLDSVTFTLTWMGAPTNFATHYANYFDGKNAALNNGDLTVNVSLMDDNLAVPLDNSAGLFASDATQPHNISISNIASAFSRANRRHEAANRIATGDDLQDWNRYIRWELNSPDFQHSIYSSRAMKKSLELSADVASQKSNIKAEDYTVNPPYTPKLKSLTLNYTASVTIDMDTYDSVPDCVFHIQPFGYMEVLPDALTGDYPMLPQFVHAGELYIGIEGTAAPQNLSMLFQMAEGSANPDMPLSPIEWSYLSGNRWVNLSAGGNLLQDSTRGLINSGMIIVSLPSAESNTLLSTELYWLRATITGSTESVCDTVAIHTQAVSVHYEPNDNAPDHLSQPLPAESITDLVSPVPEINAIKQPYTSFGGRTPEQDTTFYTRISERLRHKNRALTAWDYEHMVLDHFPQIYKVKCLPGNRRHPGRVDLIVIPDMVNKIPFNPFEPKAPADLIADIEAYLSERVPSVVRVRVRNAHYIPVKVRFAIRFLPGFNQSFYTNQLNEDLNRFLAPWAYDDSAEIIIGGRIYANVIINFIENRPYVDYVAQIKLFSSEDGEHYSLVQETAEDGYWVEAHRPDGVLVAAQVHEIDMISEAGFDEEIFTGLEYMKIELDFVVGS